MRPGRALRAVAALVRDPEDTPQVFALIEALSGTRTPRRLARRLAGSRLLCERPDIVGLLEDRAALRRLPPDSLGRAYLDFVEAAGISAEGLRAASRGRDVPAEADVAYLHGRLRDTHDLWHVVLGLGTDLPGEAALLAFTLAQTGDPAMAVLVLVGVGKLRATPGAWRLMAGAFVRGLRAASFPAQEWEALLAQPVEALRRRLRAGPFST